MDQRGSTYSKRRTEILEPGRGELHAEPHVRPISCHVASLSWQEPEEELNKLLLMKVSDRDRNVKVKMFGCVEVIIFLQPTESFKNTSSGNIQPMCKIRLSCTKRSTVKESYS